MGPVSGPAVPCGSGGGSHALANSLQTEAQVMCMRVRYTRGAHSWQPLLTHRHTHARKRSHTDPGEHPQVPAPVAHKMTFLAETWGLGGLSEVEKVLRATTLLNVEDSPTTTSVLEELPAHRGQCVLR